VKYFDQYGEDWTKDFISEGFTNHDLTEMNTYLLENQYVLS